jgi:hypothetical protein
MVRYGRCRVFRAGKASSGTVRQVALGKAAKRKVWFGLVK